jgi:tetratricopeptide (TPR) repeat protein
MAAQGPTVLVFDDMHWAHPGTLAFLEHLASHLPGVPVLILVVARPELRDERPGIADSGRWVTIDLHPLSAGETKRLVGFLAGASAAEIEPSVAERCGGNPFFTEELVRLLRERSSFQTASSARPQDAAETVVPDSLTALVAARLDALDPHLKAVLSDAAVVGLTFWPGALVAAGGIDRHVLDGHLGELAKREFLRRVPASSLAGEVEYAFWHGLTREVAYAALPRGVKAAKHAAVAQWIESGEQKGATAEVLAHHYDRALELAEAAGDDDLAGRLTEPAVRALWAAGDSALSLDVVVAERHYRHALRLCPDGSPLEPGLLVSHGEALLERGDLVGARSALEKGLLGLREAGESRAEAVATDRLAYTLWILGDARAIEVATRAAALIEGEPASAEQVKVLADWAAMCAASYESESAIAGANRALDLGRELRLPTSVRALGWRGLARGMAGDAGGLDDMRRAIGLAKRQGLGRYVGMLYSNLSWTSMPFRGPRAALRVLREGLAFAGERGDQMSMIGIQCEEALALAWVGRWDEALTLAGKVEAPVADADQILDLATVRAALAGILTARGQAAGPDVQAVAAWAHTRMFPDRGNTIDVLSAVAEARIALGERDEALSLLRHLAEVRESISSCPQFGLTLPAQLRMAAALDDLDLARRFAAKTVASRPLDSHTLVLLSALEAEHGGRLDEAARHYAEAASRWRAFGVPWEEAQALLGQGRSLVALGRAEDSIRPLQRAARVFKRLGAAPALSRTLQLLGSRAAVRTRGARG